MVRSTTLAVGILIAIMDLNAVPIAPLSYTASPGDRGAFDFSDQTGRQLIDGVRGQNWASDLGNGRGYEWIGWQFGSPLIQFKFDSIVEIQTVSIGLQREELFAPALLPARITVGTTDFILDGDELPDASWGDLDFEGSWIGDSLSIRLWDHGVVSDHNGTRLDDWIFADEISFQGTIVPESSTVGWISGGLVSLLAFATRRARSNRSYGPSSSPHSSQA